MSIDKSLSVLVDVEGTLIADLKSLEFAASEREINDELKPRLPGGLNYALFLTGLVACEALGFLISKNTKSGDTSDCIAYFINSPYFDLPEVKKDNYLKALISLRTNLAHMYGVTNFSLEGEEKELILCVGGIRDHALLSSTKEVKLNGIKFVRAIIDGFELLKKHVVDSKSKISGVVCEKSQV